MKHCDGCGDCCTAGPCGASVALLGTASDQPCSALEYDTRKARYWCGLMRRPNTYVDLGAPAEWKDKQLGKLIGKILGTEEGCCNIP